MIIASLDLKKFNVSDSVFETKGGLRASLHAVSTEEAFNAVMMNPRIRQINKHHRNALKVGGDAVSTDVEGGAAMLKKFNETMRKAVNAELFSRTALPRAEWTPKVFGFQVISTSDAYQFVGWAHMGLLEARMMMSGT